MRTTVVILAVLILAGCNNKVDLYTTTVPGGADVEMITTVNSAPKTVEVPVYRDTEETLALLEEKKELLANQERELMAQDAELSRVNAALAASQAALAVALAKQPVEPVVVTETDYTDEYHHVFLYGDGTSDWEGIATLVQCPGQPKYNACTVGTNRMTYHGTDEGRHLWKISNRTGIVKGGSEITCHKGGLNVVTIKVTGDPRQFGSCK